MSLTEEDVRVQKSIRVKANADTAFRVFCQDMDSWWPRSHHIGSSPMSRVVVEGHQGGRLYSEQQDGTACDWGEVLVWEPPRRFVMAWKITPKWGYEADPAKCSEVEVTFTPADDGTTLVELEHRFFNRHGEGAEIMRETVNKEGGWSTLLTLYKSKAEVQA